MSAALIAQLLATFGPSAIQLITQLIALAESNTNVTAAQWQTLISSLQVPASTVATNALQNAGVDTSAPLPQAVINLTK